MNKAPAVLDAMLSPRALAGRLGVSLVTVRRWIARGDISPVYRPGGRLLLIPESAAASFLERYKL